MKMYRVVWEDVDGNLWRSDSKLEGEARKYAHYLETQTDMKNVRLEEQ